MTKTYERPTDDLRQVRYGIHGETLIVQRKWLVRDGKVHANPSMEVYNMPEAHQEALHAGLVHGIRDRYGDETRYVLLKPVWRDLPIVSAEEARQ